MKEVGRNDPCPCGSGKKYKKCCGLKSGPKQRTFTQVNAPNAQASIQRITGVLSKALRQTHPEAADKLDDVVKESIEKNLGSSNEDVDPKS